MGGGTSATGLGIKGTNAHVEITRMAISGFDRGLHLHRVKNLKITDSVIEDTLDTGVRVKRSENITIGGVIIRRAGGRGIFVKDSASVIIEGNMVRETGNRGIDIIAPYNGITVRGNIVTLTTTKGAGGECFQAWGERDENNKELIFSHNIAINCADEGLEFVGVVGGEIKSNISAYNVGQGIDLFAGSNKNKIHGNITINNRKNPMQLTNSSSNVIQKNIFDNKSKSIRERKNSLENIFRDNIIR